ncbi:MAG: hypothetical protein RL291_1746 [Pseudomonadota bacterium]
MLFRMLFGVGRQMAYTVHTPPNPALDRLDHAEQLVFVKDGFTPSAFFFGPFWLVAHGAWWAVIGYAVAAAVAFGTTWLLGLPAGLAILALVAVHFMLGFEADEIHRLWLEQRGWQTIGSVTGATPLECERRFFDMWLPATPVRIGGPRPNLSLPGGDARVAGGQDPRGLLGLFGRRQ